jgi:hypothetical protein
MPGGGAVRRLVAKKLKSVRSLLSKSTDGGPEGSSSRGLDVAPPESWPERRTTRTTRRHHPLSPPPADEVEDAEVEHLEEEEGYQEPAGDQEVEEGVTRASGGLGGS